MAATPFDLTGKVALVTGGNGGIGKGMALGLAGAGASVVVAARNQDKMAVALEEIRATGAEAVGVHCDVTDPASVEAAIRAAGENFGGLDILVNNSGTTVRAYPQDTSAEDWDRVIGVNLSGVFRVSCASRPAMVERGGGKIINIGSMMSIFGSEYAAAYAASKGGVVQLTKSCAVAWAEDNIQVNAVLPGWITTEMTDGLVQRFPERRQMIQDRTPAGRWGLPPDLAGVAVFLASAASDFVTGAAIPVDGGYSVK